LKIALVYFILHISFEYFREAAWNTHHRSMCSASAHNRALKDFCASLHSSLQPLRCYPMLLAKIVASENSATLVDSNIMKMFYGGNGSDSTTSLSSSSSSAPLAFRNLDMVTLSQLVSAAAGVTSAVPTTTAARLLQLVAANALSLRPMSQFPDYVQSMKRALVKSEYDAAVQELLSGMPRGASLHSVAAMRCSFSHYFMMQRWTGVLSTAFTAASAASSAAAFFLCNRKLTTIARRTLRREAAASAARALKLWPFGP
jgi:hypothetical protein